MVSTKKLDKVRARRQKRVRVKIFGTESRPRLSVFRSSRHIYVQAIADDVGKTLADASTMSGELKDSLGDLKKREVAEKVGQLIAKRLLEKNIRNVIFDRGKFLYHGRVRALADAARKAGLEF